MIFAAGLGTRLRPLTNDRPKALVEVGGKTMLERVIRKLVRYGFEEIVVNVHHFADKMIDFLEVNQGFGADIHISDERDAVLETGGGLKRAASFFDDGKPFLVHNVDVLSDLDLGQLYRKHVESEALVTLAVRQRLSSRYLLFNDAGILCGWRNVKTGEEKISRTARGELTELAFSGIHVVNPQLFELMWREGKFSIIPTYLDVAQTKDIVGYRDDTCLWMDIGKPERLREANALFS